MLKLANVRGHAAAACLPTFVHVAFHAAGERLVSIHFLTHSRGLRSALDFHEKIIGQAARSVAQWVSRAVGAAPTSGADARRRHLFAALVNAVAGVVSCLLDVVQ